MAATTQITERNTETTYDTVRVFLRAEHGDPLRVKELVAGNSDAVPAGPFTVVRRDQTYHGPKIWIESDTTGDQAFLTCPGPDSEAYLWRQTDKDWTKVAEVAMDFDGDPPQYDLCPHCNEPLSTTDHIRLSAIGACDPD